MNISRFLAGVALLLSACQPQHVVHEYHDFPTQEWIAQSPATFSFDVPASGEYLLNYNVRNTREYPFYNLFVRYELLDSKGNIVRQSLSESNLMHPKTGQPLGNGESLYDHTVTLFHHKFENPGSYQFRISQYMRIDTLKGIQAVGFTLDKVEK